MIIEKTCKAMCGGDETFTFKADTIEDFVLAVAKEAENQNSCFSYYDAAVLLFEEDSIAEMIKGADNAAKGMAIRIRAKADTQQANEES